MIWIRNAAKINISKKNQTYILELRNLINQTKNTVENLDIRLDQAEYRISELKEKEIF